MWSTWRKAIGVLVVAFAPMLAFVPAGDASGADVVHVVGKGQSIEQVAKKYGVPVKAIVAANKLKDPTKLKAGTKLVIPGVKASASVATKTTATNYASKPPHAGRVTLVRFGTKETQVIQVVSKKGKLMPGVLPHFARMMRFGPTNMEHAIDPRLAILISKVSDHFGGKPIEIISGFRPKTPTQYTPHSNHNLGRAIDMRIAGVPNEVLRDFCKTFKQVGVGYYPNSLFVHFDVRKVSTTWIDLSKPGEPPKYVGSVSTTKDVDHDVDDTEGVDLEAGSASSAASTKSSATAVASTKSSATAVASSSATAAPKASAPPATSASQK